MKKILVALLSVVLFLSACGVETPAVPTTVPTVAPTAEPIAVSTEIPLPVMVAERGKLSLMQTEVEVKQGECSLNVIELESLVSDLRFNFLPMDQSNPLNDISPCIGSIRYGAGTGSKKFGVHVPISWDPGVYQVEIKVFIWIDNHSGETLSLPMTVIVSEK
jgi:hypothetical protein